MTESVAATPFHLYAVPFSICWQVSFGVRRGASARDVLQGAWGKFGEPIEAGVDHTG